jgi:proteasome lid subunit RPN8/RPN11
LDTLTGEPVLTISESHWQQMQADVNAKAPVEACGLLAGKNGIVQRVYLIANALSSKTSFRMAAQEQIKAFLEIDTLNLDLLAFYLSHPNGSPMPSATDLLEFTYPGVLSICIPMPRMALRFFLKAAFSNG